jgi:hypothetical protein
MDAFLQEWNPWQIIPTINSRPSVILKAAPVVQMMSVLPQTTP